MLPSVVLFEKLSNFKKTFRIFNVFSGVLKKVIAIKIILTLIFKQQHVN